MDKTISWTAAGTLQVTLNQDLEKATTYTVSVLYANDQIHSFSFTTSDITQEQLAEDISEQVEGDKLFAEAERVWYQENPWYTEIPMVNEDYTIVYDFAEKSFRIRLTLGDNPLGAQIEAAKTKALDSLEAIGVDLNVYDYYVLIN
jgi:hypothetical protein